MKKYFLVALLLVLLIIIALYPVTRKQTLAIAASYENTAPEVLHLDRWKDWYPAIKAAYEKNPGSFHVAMGGSSLTDTLIIPGQRIRVRTIAPMSYEITENTDGLEESFVLSVMPTDAPRKMTVTTIRRKPLVATLWSADPQNSPAAGLKHFLEDPEELYGYAIEVSQIRDPVIASTVCYGRQNDLFGKLVAADSLLMEYVRQKGLLKTGHISVSYVPLAGDSLQMTVGIPVNGSADSTRNIKCLSLPEKGRVLVGRYSGTFSGRNALYQAMTRYLTDHTLSIPAQSFERYLNDTLPAAASSHIDIELDYPIY